MLHSQLKRPTISTLFQRPSEGVGKCDFRVTRAAGGGKKMISQMASIPSANRGTITKLWHHYGILNKLYTLWHYYDNIIALLQKSDHYDALWQNPGKHYYYTDDICIKAILTFWIFYGTYVYYITIISIIAFWTIITLMTLEYYYCLLWQLRNIICITIRSEVSFSLGLWKSVLIVGLLRALKSRHFRISMQCQVRLPILNGSWWGLRTRGASVGSYHYVVTAWSSSHGGAPAPAAAHWQAGLSPISCEVSFQSSMHRAF